MVFSAIAALGSAYLSKQGADKANQQTSKQYALALGEQQRRNAANESLRAQALQQGYRGLNDVREGFQQGLGSLSAYGVEANRQVADLQRRGGAQAQAGGYSRGLTNSTAQAGLQQQATYNASRAQGSIAERLAALRSRLYQSQGQALAGARGNIANILQSNAAGGAGDSARLSDLYGSLQHESNPVNLGALGASLDGLFNKEDPTKEAQELEARRAASVLRGMFF